LVIPVGSGSTQIMKLIILISETDFKEQNFGDFSFVPLLGGTN